MAVAVFVECDSAVSIVHTVTTTPVVVVAYRWVLVQLSVLCTCSSAEAFSIYPQVGWEWQQMCHGCLVTAEECSTQSNPLPSTERWDSHDLWPV